MQPEYQISTVGVFIFNDKGELFLMKSPKWKNNYVCPGGKIEYGESMADTVRREVKEETNLELTDIEFFLAMDGLNLRKEYEGKYDQLLFHNFTAKVKNQDKLKLDGIEGKEFKWLKLEEWLELGNIEKYTKKAIQELLAKKHDYKTLYLHALADYQNLLKQTQKDKMDFAKYANEGLLHDILPVYDNLKIAVEHADEKNHDAWLQGVVFVIKQFKTALENAGIQEIRTIGQNFDHNLMEAVENMETDDKDNDHVVAKELKAGYTLNGKVIVPARVAVYKFQMTNSK